MAEISVTVKTLDSQNHQFAISEMKTVKEFKEEIAGTVLIPHNQQRLIFRGRVLQDDRKLVEYNIGGNTIHLVQRPLDSDAGTTNDEPPRRAPRAHNHGFGEIHFGEGGIFVSGAGTDRMGDEGNLGVRRNSAALRLHVGQMFLNRASTLLGELEESDEAAAARSRQNPAPEPEPETFDESVGVVNGEIIAGSAQILGGSNSPMEVDVEDPSAFGRMISQVASAASAAAVVAALRGANQQENNNIGDLVQNAEISIDGGNPIQIGQQPPAPDSAQAPLPNSVPVVSSTSNSAGVGFQPRTPWVRRPEAPRLRELAIALQDIMAFNERLAPLFRTLHGMLRENRTYTSTEETAGVQYVMDSTSRIMHLISHAYHALSDITCDFSQNRDVRRLGATTSILIEQSTVVRATIPIAIPNLMMAAQVAQQQAQQQQQQQGQQGTQGQGPQMQQNTQGQGQTTHGLGQGQLPQGLLGVLQGAQGLGQGQQGDQAHLGHHVLHGMDPHSAHVIIGTIDGSALNQHAQGLAQGFAQGTAQGTAQGFAQGTAQGPAQRHAHDLGNGQPQGMSINIQANSGIPDVNALSFSQLFGPNVQLPGGNVGMGQPGGQNRAGRPPPPFDILLSCHSHHTSRTNRPPHRPSQLHQIVKYGEVPRARSSVDFFESFIDIFRSSSILEQSQRVFRDVLSNYLMRGRDPKNLNHVQSCARSLGKFVVQFLTSFMRQLVNRDGSVDYEMTFGTLVTKCFSDLIRLTLECNGQRLFRNSALKVIEDFLYKSFAIFRAVLPNQSGIPEIFANFFASQYLVGMPQVFRNYAVVSLTEYFTGYCDSTNELATAPPRLVKKKREEGQNEEGDRLGGGESSPSLPKQEKKEEPKVKEVPIEKPMTQKPNVENSSLMEVEEEELDLADERMSRFSRPGPSHPNLQTLVRNLPEGWRDVVTRDVQKQMNMRIPEKLSEGFYNIIPKK